MNIADLRKEYMQGSLNETLVPKSPFDLFQQWFEQALQAELPEPNAMTVCTVSPEGKPSARILLIKGFDETGFVFFTNYNSRKGAELENNPNAALLFYWPELERQVRIEGVVTKISSQESENYYNSRPLGSRLGAWASPQSKPIESREAIEKKFKQVRIDFGQNPKRPSFWGGYRLNPNYFEYWQGRESRLHDRIAYQEHNENWLIGRLAP